VIYPSVYPWVEESDEFASPPQNRPDVATFMAVTEDTRIRQVVRLRRTAMLHADDVVNLTSEERVFLMNQAILTKIVCASGNNTPKVVAYVATHWQYTGAHVLSPAS